MQITDVEYYQNEGYPLMRAKIDGQETVINAEQKLTLIENGIVSCGASMADKFSVEFNGQRFRGCTDDPEVVKAVMTFGNAVRTGTFKPGRIED
jgi:hypothetical protein